MLKIAGIRHADVRGYPYSREDVTARALANAYAQTLGQVFTHEMKPYEVEILVAQVGDHDGEPNELFHILYDGTVMDEHGFTVLGGQAEAISDDMLGPATPRGSTWPAPCASAPRRWAGPTAATSRPTQLEVAVLDRNRSRRRFRRVDDDELAGDAGPADPPAQLSARVSPARHDRDDPDQWRSAGQDRPEGPVARAVSPGASRCGGRSSTESTSSTSRTSLASSRSCSGTNTSTRLMSPTVNCVGAVDAAAELDRDALGLEAGLRGPGPRTSRPPW